MNYLMNWRVNWVIHSVLGVPSRPEPAPVMFSGVPSRPEPNPVTFSGVPSRLEPNPVMFSDVPSRPDPNPVMFSGVPSRPEPNPVMLSGFTSCMLNFPYFLVFARRFCRGRVHGFSFFDCSGSSYFLLIEFHSAFPYFTKYYRIMFSYCFIFY